MLKKYDIPKTLDQEIDFDQFYNNDNNIQKEEEKEEPLAA